jgi:hypothetical protein
MAKNKLTDDSEDKKYFTLTPQIVWALSRDAYDFTLWSVIKMVAGENGECILSTEDLAQLAMMSVGKVSECRKYLLSQKLLKGQCRKDPGYPQPVWHLTVPNLWRRNVEWRNSIGDELSARIELKRQQRGKSLHQVKPSPGEEGTSPGEEGTSPGEAKKNHEGEPKGEHGAIPFFDFFSADADPTAGLPVGTDGHQRAVDKANGAKVDPVEEVARHHYWGFMDKPGIPLPAGKQRIKWIKASERLLNTIPRPWDLRAVCAAIDFWWQDSKLDDFWKDKPCNDDTLNLISKFVAGGAKPRASPDVPDWVHEERKTETPDFLK